MMSAQYSSAGAPLQSRASRPASALRTVAQPLQVATNTLGTRKRTKDMASIFDKRSASNNREATRPVAPPLKSAQAARRGPTPSDIRPAPPISTAQVQPVPPPVGVNGGRPQTRFEREKKRHYNDPPHVGPWKLGKLIGQGASGRVRLAIHTRTQQLAAVKIIPKQMLINSRMSLRDLSAKQDKLTLGIEREIVIMKLIVHPNLLGLWDVYETSKELFLVMEYVAGGELFDYLVARGRLQPHEARQYFRQIIFGVDYCHTFSICHRDLKPENLLLDGSRSTVKIADFGMAALQPTEKMLETSCGSPHYASPEIVSGMTYDGTASDIWSCGIILFALLCGRLPFDDPNIQVLLGKVRSGKFAMPSHLEPSVQDLISRMLQVDPKKRASMQEICSHPWFTDNGRLSSQNPVTSEVGTLSKEPIRLAEIDPDILGNLSTLWPELSHEQIIRRLLQSGQNWQKTFYTLLVIHRDTHSSDDEEEADDLDEDERLQLKQASAQAPPLVTTAPSSAESQPISPRVAPPIVPASMGTPLTQAVQDPIEHRQVSVLHEGLDEREPAPVVTPVGPPAAAQLTSTPPRTAPGRTAGRMDSSSNSTLKSMSVDEDYSSKDTAQAPASNAASVWLIEQVRAEHARSEQLKNEQLEAEKRRMEQLKAERIMTEQRRIEQARAEQARAEQAKIEQAKAEQAKIEQAKAEQAKIEQAKAEQLKAEQAKIEQARVEQAKVEQARAEQAKIEQVKAEQLKAEQAKIEQVRAEQLKAEQDKAVRLKEQVRIEQAKTEQLKVQRAKAEQTKAEQLKAEQIRLERARAEQAREVAESKQMPSREDASGRRLSSLFTTLTGRKPSFASIRQASGSSSRSSMDVRPAPPVMESTTIRPSTKASTLAFGASLPRKPVPSTEVPKMPRVSEQVVEPETNKPVVQAASTIRPTQKEPVSQAAPPDAAAWKQRLPSLSQPARSVSQNGRDDSTGEDSLMRMFMREIADELDSLDAMSTSMAMPMPTSQAPPAQAAQPAKLAQPAKSQPAPSMSLSSDSEPDASVQSANRYDDANEDSLLVASHEPSLPDTQAGASKRIQTPVYAAFARHAKNQNPAPTTRAPLRPRQSEGRAQVPGMPQVRQPQGARDIPPPGELKSPRMSQTLDSPPASPHMRPGAAMPSSKQPPVGQRMPTRPPTASPPLPQSPHPAMSVRPVSPLPTSPKPNLSVGMGRPSSPTMPSRVPLSNPAVSAGRPTSPTMPSRVPMSSPVTPASRPTSPSMPSRVPVSSPMASASRPSQPGPSSPGRSQSPMASPGRPTSPTTSASRPKTMPPPQQPSSPLGSPRRPQSPFDLASRSSSVASPKPSGRTVSSGTGSSNWTVRTRRSFMGALRGHDDEPKGLGLDIIGVDSDAPHVPQRPTSPMGGDAQSIGARQSWFHGLLPRRQMHVLMSVENLTLTMKECDALLAQLGATPTAMSRAQMSYPLTQQGPKQYLLEKLFDPKMGQTAQTCKPMRFRVEYTILPVRSQRGGRNVTPTSPGMPGFDPRSNRPMSPVLGGGPSTLTPSFATSVTLTHEKGSLATFRLFMDRLRRNWDLDTCEKE